MQIETVEKTSYNNFISFTDKVEISEKLPYSEMVDVILNLKRDTTSKYKKPKTKREKLKIIK